MFTRRVTSLLRPAVRSIRHANYETNDNLVTSTYDNVTKAIYGVTNPSLTDFQNKKLTHQDIEKIWKNLTFSATTYKNSNNRESCLSSCLSFGPESEKSSVILTMIHGNEAAGLAAIANCIFLEKSNLLKQKTYVILGNPIAALQYFSHLKELPFMPTNTRDHFRSGVCVKSNILSDPNRVNVKILEPDYIPPDRNQERMQEILKFLVAVKPNFLLDIHTQREGGAMITGCNDENLLKNSPISTICKGLLDSIGKHDSLVPFKLVALKELPHLSYIGIESGEHEKDESVEIAQKFSLTFLANIGACPPELSENKKNKQRFTSVEVNSAIYFSDLKFMTSKHSLAQKNSNQTIKNDEFYTVKEIHDQASLGNDDLVIITETNGNSKVVNYAEAKLGNYSITYKVHQYLEFEQIEKDQVVAIAIPSGNELLAPKNMSGIFTVKSKKNFLSLKDSFPVDAEKLQTAKFLYPIKAKNITINFNEEQEKYKKIQKLLEKAGIDYSKYIGSDITVISPLSLEIVAKLKSDNAASLAEKLENTSLTQRKLDNIYQAGNDSKQNKLSKQLTDKELTEYLQNIATKIRSYEEIIKEVIHTESGKSNIEAEQEINNAISTIHRMIENDKFLKRSDEFYEERNAKGTSLVISPFNFPFAIALWSIVPALLSHNTVIFKPSEKTPVTGILLYEIMQQSLLELQQNSSLRNDFPKQLVQLCLGGKEVVEQLCNSKEIKMVCATGSETMGQNITKLISDRNIKPVLELGGNNAVIISNQLDQESLEKAVNAVFDSATSYSGQKCTCTRRLLIHSDIYETAISLLKQKYSEMISEARYSPLIDEAAGFSYEETIRIAKNEGGKDFLSGQVMQGDNAGNYYKPTFIEMPDHKEIMNREFFGPILYVQKYSDLDQAISDVNKPNNSGLVNAIYSQSRSEISQFIENVESGHVMANPASGTNIPANGAEFKGLKNSGSLGMLGPDPFRHFVSNAASEIRQTDQLNPDIKHEKNSFGSNVTFHRNYIKTNESMLDRVTRLEQEELER